MTTKERRTLDQVADDEMLDGMFGRLLAALDTSDRDLHNLWKEFEDSLDAHMSDEEQRITPKLVVIRLREAHAILQEHRHLRARLKEIGEAIGRGDVRRENVASFRDELRAHARHEEAILLGMGGHGDP